MKNKCWWSHEWSNWETKEYGDVLHINNKNIIGKYLIQERKCKICGKKEIESKYV